MPRKSFDAASTIRDLCDYAQKNLDLQYLDSVYAENQLLALFNLTEPKGGSSGSVKLQKDILDPLVDYAIKQKMIDDTQRLLFETKIIGLVTPSPTLVEARFDGIASSDGVEKATDYLNNLSISSNYIRMADINKNIKWQANTPKGNLIITINLAKPEKDNKQVKLEKSAPVSSYPPCPLCISNLGFNGNILKAARQTLRVIPIMLNDEEWFFQYSPYVYYDHHAIAFSKEHRPMYIDSQTFTRLFDFVDLFPHYFIGSNSDLPIVGGSILSHEHFQGGKKVLPMLSRPDRATYAHPSFKDVEVSVLDWYNSVIKLKSTNRQNVEKLATMILSNWRTYSDHSVDIWAFTDENHNTVTPVAAIEDGKYTLYIILRNNRTTQKYPHGLFHPAEDLHNIKKEAIGIIEAMGLFILPGRLFSETKEIANILMGEKPLNFAEIADEQNPLNKHLTMICQLTNDNGVSVAESKAEELIIGYINNAAVKILEATAVFKENQQGIDAFNKFLKSVEIVPKDML